jgi:ubiquinone/menaquinone biosynthesis C-methylase UbiE
VQARTEQVSRVFDQFVDRYDAWYDTAQGSALFDLERASLEPLLRPGVGPRLEVGVGSGRFAAALGVEVGIDPAAAALSLARSRGVHVVRGRGEQLPFREAVFSAVLLVATLCFVADPSLVLAEAARVLGPCGRVVLGVMPLDSPWGRAYKAMGKAGDPFYRHARLLRLADHHRLLNEAGLQVVESRSSLLEGPSDEPVARTVRPGALAGAGFVALAAIRSSGR